MTTQHVSRKAYNRLSDAYIETVESADHAMSLVAEVVQYIRSLREDETISVYELRKNLDNVIQYMRFYNNDDLQKIADCDFYQLPSDLDD